MKKPTRKEVFNIPNIMCYVRIALIPVFCYLYLTAETDREYLMAFAVMAISALTDLFDGKIARRFHMVSDLGKVLDPVADKLNHAALALCLAVRYPLMWALVALMAVKEGFMAVMGLKYMNKEGMMDGALWYGKVCTAGLFVGMLSLYLFHEMPLAWVHGIIMAMMALMLFSFIKYIQFYRDLGKKTRGAQ